jgi:hypothetical protein
MALVAQLCQVGRVVVLVVRFSFRREAHAFGEVVLSPAVQSFVTVHAQPEQVASVVDTGGSSLQVVNV